MILNAKTENQIRNYKKIKHVLKFHFRHFSNLNYIKIPFKWPPQGRDQWPHNHLDKISL